MRLRIAAIAAAFFLCIVNVTTAQNGQELFQQGLLKERGERDIQGAIQIYEKVVREFSSNHALAARALLQLGKVHDALGKSQARQYYDQVLKDYPDQTEIRAEAERRRKALNIAHNGLTPMPDRMIWQNPALTELNASVSFDGAYLAFIDRSPDGGLMIRDLKKGVERLLIPISSGEASSPAISRDSKRVAYSTYDPASGKAEFRVVDLNSGANRILIESRNLRYLPQDWTPAGEILTLFSLKGGGYQIAMVNVSGGLTNILKTFLNSQEPRNLTLSPDGRFIAYDYPQDKSSTARDISVLGVSGGSHEYELVHNPAHDYVLGWMPDSRWLLFGSDRGGKSGIWGIETSEGGSTATQPVRVRDSGGEIRALGTTSSASLVYSTAAKTGEVRILEGLQPELARLQLSALQRSQPPQGLSTASIEGVVAKLGTNEPIPGADLELIRLEGTAEAPLFPGFAEAFAAFSSPRVQGPPVSNSTPPALAPEVQYVSSGEDGKFVFRSLKPGKYRLVAALADGAYHPAEYGQRDPRGNGILLPVAQGQAVKDIRMEMALAGVITGRIFDGNGEPVAHAPVLAVYTVPLPRPVPFTAQVVLTDELGYYRLFWLPPGQYVVATMMVDADRRSLPTFVSLPGRTVFLAMGGIGSPPVRRSLPDGNLIDEATQVVYYGDVTDLEQARAIDLRSGGHIAGADINAAAGKKEGRHVRGVVINGATGQPAANIRVTVMPLPATVGGSGDLSGITDRNGAFDVAGIFPGRYAVFTPYLRNAATTPATAGTVGGPADTTIAYVLPIEVGNADIKDLRLVAVHPVNSKGRIIIEGRQPLEAAADLSKIRIAMARTPNWLAQAGSVPPGGGTGNGIVDERGAFTVWTSPGLWEINVSGMPTNAYVKSIRSGEYDARRNGPLLIADPAIDPIEIVIGTDAGEIRGVAVGSNGPMGNVGVELVPTLRDHLNNSRSAITELDGRFRIMGVPPGGYKIFAWEYRGPWADPQAYEASGKLIHVTEGTTQEVQVTVIPKPR